MMFRPGCLQGVVRLAAFAIVGTLAILTGCAWPSETAREFRWAGDPEGGAPFVEADPANPEKVVGFEVDIAVLIARGLGREASFVNIAFMSIDQSIERGDAEIGLSGVEDTPTRRASMATTVPYSSNPCLKSQR